MLAMPETKTTIPQAPRNLHCMQCPQCGHTEHRVIDSRPAPDEWGSEDGTRNTIRRRRKCENPECNHRFTTYEIIEDQMSIREIPIAGLWMLVTEYLKEIKERTKTIEEIEPLKNVIPPGDY